MPEPQIDTPDTTTAWPLIRDDEWADLVTLADAHDDTHAEQSRADFTSHVQQGYLAGEPLGDIWYFTPTQAPTQVTVTTKLSEYDDDDYAMRTLDFHATLSTLAGPITRTVLTISHRVDGRS